MKQTFLLVLFHLLTFCYASGAFFQTNKSEDISSGICSAGQLAVGYYHQQQYDSALYYYEQLVDCNEPEKVYSAYIGMTRINILQLNVKKANQLQFKVDELKPDVYSDSLRYADQLNVALLDLLTTNSLAKISKFIKETPEIIEDKLEACVWYTEFLIADKKYEQSGEVLRNANKLLKHHPERGDKYRIDFLFLQADLNMAYSEIRQATEVYEMQIFPSLTNRKEKWVEYKLAEAYRLSAMLYESLRRYDKALQNYFSFLEVANKLNSFPPFRYGEVYQRISNTYQQLGFYNLSDEYALKSAQINLSLNKENEEFLIRANYSQGLIHLSNKEWDKALLEFDEVINVETDNANVKIYIMESMLHKLEVYTNNKSFEEADGVYKKLNAYIDNLGDKQKEIYRFRIEYSYLDVLEAERKSEQIRQVYILLNQMIKNKVLIKYTLNLSFMNRFCEYLIAQNQLDSAYVVSETVLNLFNKKLNSPDQNFINNYLKHLVRTGYLKAYILQSKLTSESDRQRLEEVLASFTEAINWHMLTKEGYKPLEYDIYSETSVNDLFENAIDVSFDLYQMTGDLTYAETAFQFSEQSKSNRLLESLRRNLLIQNTGLPDSIVIQLRSVKEQTSFLTSELRKLSRKKNIKPEDSLKAIEYNELLLISQENNRRLMAHLETNYANYYDMNYGKQFMALVDVQKRLKPGEGLVAYFQGSNNLASITITQDTVILERGEPVSAKEVLSFRNSLIADSSHLQTDDSYQLFVREGYRLYDRLLKKPIQIASNETKIRKLYIIPDKSLNFLPFEQLLTADADTTGPDYGVLPYLIKTCQVSYGVSSSVLFETESNDLSGDHTGKLLAMAPTYSGILGNPEKLKELSQFRDGFSDLRYNQQEVKAIRANLPGSMLTGEYATEKLFYQQLKDYDVFHFAMHGLVDLDEPQYSRLVFAADQKDTVNDNFLHNFEIYNMNIPAQMVVLSACNTGVGKLIDGEGVMSMSRAFTYAGIQSVVMTQWPAEDQSSSEIMQSFYRYLADGKAKDEALRLAKLDYLDNAHPLKKNPYYWNNFIISGQVQPLQIKRDYTYLWWIAIVGISLAVLIVFFLRRSIS